MKDHSGLFALGYGLALALPLFCFRETLPFPDQLIYFLWLPPAAAAVISRRRGYILGAVWALGVSLPLWWGVSILAMCRFSWLRAAVAAFACSQLCYPLLAACFSAVKTRRLAARAILAIMAAAALLAGLIGYRNASKAPELTRVDLRLKEFPQNLTLAVIADTHLLDTPQDLERLRRAVAEVNAQNPDMILLPGDYCGRGMAPGQPASPEQAAEILGELRAPAGVFAILGNHDRRTGAQRFRDVFQPRGIRLLEHDAEVVEFNGVTMKIADLPENPPEECFADPGMPLLLLSHSPDNFELLREATGNMLMVSGHTHGGQVVLPLLGPLLVPSKYGTRFAAGSHGSEERRLFVSRGVGTSFVHLRLFCPAEITLIRINPDGP